MAANLADAQSHPEGMDYLVTRQRKFWTTYLPLMGFGFVLLFPFYWMTVTSFKANDDL